MTLPQNCLLLPSPLQPEAVHLRAGKGLPGWPHKCFPGARVIWQRLHYHSLRGGWGRFPSPPLSARQKKPQRRGGSCGRLPGTPRLLSSNLYLLDLTSTSAHLLACQASQALPLPQGSSSPSVKVCPSCVPGGGRRELMKFSLFCGERLKKHQKKCCLLAGCRYQRLHRTGPGWTDQ